DLSRGFVSLIREIIRVGALQSEHSFKIVSPRAVNARYFEIDRWRSRSVLARCFQFCKGQIPEIDHLQIRGALSVRLGLRRYRLRQWSSRFDCCHRASER